MKIDLSQSLKSQIQDVLAQGDQLVESSASRDAWGKYLEALALIPEPKYEYALTTRVLSAIGNAAFLRKSYSKAKDALEDAIRCPGGLGDVFIHLRLGQCNFELGDRHRAADNLARAYMGGGREAFAREDPKYLALVEEVLKPPAGLDKLPE
jgi:tetratricopeptide (TPR) repeat protein